MMLAQREGCVVNILQRLRPAAFPTQGAYNMSKFAVRGLRMSVVGTGGTGVRAVWSIPRHQDNFDKVAGGPARVPSSRLGREGLEERADRGQPEECAPTVNAFAGATNDLPVTTSTTLFWLAGCSPTPSVLIKTPL